MNYHLGIALSYRPHKLRERNAMEICFKVKHHFHSCLMLHIGKPARIISDITLIECAKYICVFCEIHTATKQCHSIYRWWELSLV